MDYSSDSDRSPCLAIDNLRIVNLRKKESLLLRYLGGDYELARVNKLKIAWIVNYDSMVNV